MHGKMDYPDTKIAVGEFAAAWKTSYGRTVLFAW